MFIPHVSEALRELLSLSKAEELKTMELLKQILEQKRGKLEDIGFDPAKNTDYDETLANIGKDNKANTDVKRDEVVAGTLQEKRQNMKSSREYDKSKRKAHRKSVPAQKNPKKSDSQARDGQTRLK